MAEAITINLQVVFAAGRFGKVTLALPLFGTPVAKVVNVTPLSVVNKILTFAPPVKAAVLATFQVTV